MNQKLLSSLTASLLITTLGLAPSGNATQPEASTQSLDNSPQAPSNSSTPAGASDLGVKQGAQLTQGVRPTGGETLEESRFPLTAATASNVHPDSLPRSQPDGPSEVVKVGEQKPQTSLKLGDVAIAKVQTHELAGRKAATLYVRNIPVLTFTAPSTQSHTVQAEPVKLGQYASPSTVSVAVAAKSLINGETNSSTGTLLETSQDLVKPGSEDTELSQTDPIWRASALAAKLNQLNRDGIDAKQITVSWEAGSGASATGDRYSIKMNDTVLTALDSNTLLPDTTRNPETDALQATNRLRRLLGDAAPLSGVSGKPARQLVSLGLLNPSGWASWYGPGFNGNASASGETFDQNALTAAHRSLPFGTRVLVTNLDNGKSIVVRINDRGPYYGNRIIDLSAAAARFLGVIQTGVAPVRLDIVDRQASLAGN